MSSLLELEEYDDIWSILMICLVKSRFNNVIKECKKKWGPLLDEDGVHYTVFNNMGRYFLEIYNFMPSSSYFKIMEPSKIVNLKNKLRLARSQMLYTEKVRSTSSQHKIDDLFPARYFIYGYELELISEKLVLDGIVTIMGQRRYVPGYYLCPTKMILYKNEMFSETLKRISYYNDFEDIINTFNNYSVVNFISKQEDKLNKRIYCSIIKDFIGYK